MAKWDFRWSAVDGTQYNLPCIDERKVNFRLNQPGTCELTIPLRTEVGRYIAAGSGWGYILAYKDNTLRMVLETVSTDVGPASSEGIPSIAIVGTESAYMRCAGIIPNAPNPYKFPANGTDQIGVQLATLFNANAGAWGIGPEVPGVTPVVMPSILEAGLDLLSIIQAFAFRGSGFDFRFNPRFENLGVGQQVVGNFQCAGTIGVTRNNCKFEFGVNTRSNLTGYSWKRLGGDHLINSAWVPANDSAGKTVDSGDLGSALTYGLRARWLTADFNDATLRTQYASEQITYRKVPRRILSITPNADMGLGNVPKPLDDYGIGDIVPVSITDDGFSIINGNVRVYGLNFTIDKDGKENVEIETSPETA